jgi:hypothetical protein
MNVTHAAVAQYRSRTHAPAPDVCCQLAEINRKNPLIYIAAAEAQRARSPEVRKRWLGRIARANARPKRTLRRR